MNRSNKNYREETNDKAVVDDTVDKLLENIIDEQVKIFGESEIKNEE